MIRAALDPAALSRALGRVSILLLPFAVFFWMYPWSRLFLGMDYGLFSTYHSLHLLFSLRNGTFPLYVPGFDGAGVSAAALTLGQLYHPASYIASLLPGFWEGRAVEAYTLVALVSIGLTQIFLYSVFKKELGQDRAAAFILSFLSVYNLRMLELFRYQASLYSYLGFLFLAGFILRFYVRGCRLRDGLGIAASTYGLVTSGHPQMAYYGLLGASGLIFAGPIIVTAARDAGRSMIKIWAYLCAGVLLAAPYILAFKYEFLDQKSVRVERDYIWSLSKSYDFNGLVALADSFMRPFAADVGNAFGGSALFLIVPFAALPYLFRKSGKRAAVAVLAVLLLTTILISLGDLTPVYRLFWEHAPFASSFRGPGRANLSTPLLLSILLAVIWRHEPGAACRENEVFRVQRAILWIGAAGVLLYNFAAGGGSWGAPGPYAPQTIQGLTIGFFWAWASLGAAALVCMAVAESYDASNIWRWIAIIFLVAQTALGLRYGHWTKELVSRENFAGMTGNRGVRFMEPTPTFKELSEKNAARLSYEGIEGYGLSPIRTMLHQAYAGRRLALEPLARFKWRVMQTEPKSIYTHIRKGMDRENVIDDTGSLPIKRAFADKKGAYVRLEYASFNRLDFVVTTNSPGYLVLSYPYSAEWTVRLNGRDGTIQRVDGIKMAVQVNAGRSIIMFQYFSMATLIGVIISMLTVVLLGVLVAMRLPVRLRPWFLILILSAAAASAVIWERSCRGGRNLGTHYEWRAVEENGIFKEALISSGDRS